MHHVEIGVVFLLDKRAKFFLCHSVNVLERVLMDSVLFEKFNSFLEGELHNGLLDLERFERELLVDCSDFFRKASF